jgi:hypothetical protein
MRALSQPAKGPETGGIVVKRRTRRVSLVSIAGRNEKKGRGEAERKKRRETRRNVLPPMPNLLLPAPLLLSPFPCLDQHTHSLPPSVNKTQVSEHL